MSRLRHRPSRGFTLIEMILVLVVFGLLLGGVLKTTEMINSAKVKALADRRASFEYAWYTFIDRYGGMPTKVRNIRSYLPDLAFERSIDRGDGFDLRNLWLDWEDGPPAFHHLKFAGLLKCDVCTVDQRRTPTRENLPDNGFGGILSVRHETGPGVQKLIASSTQEPIGRPVALFLGAAIPSNIVAEFDRKYDDGAPHTGKIRFTWNFLGSHGGIGELVDGCVNLRADGHPSGIPSTIRRPVLYWRPAGSRPPVFGNCSAAVLL